MHLLDPISPDAFAREYWERRPLLVERNDPTYYETLLTLANVDDILSTSSAHSGQLQAVRDGKGRPLAKNTSGLGGTFAEAWYDEYRAGSTIVLQALHERWPPLRRLCQALAAEFSSGFQVNVYVTPPGAQGLSTHFDTHDVFVVQIAGSKRWRVFDRTIELPPHGQAPVRMQARMPGAGRGNNIVWGDMDPRASIRILDRDPEDRVIRVDFDPKDPIHP